LLEGAVSGKDVGDFLVALIEFFVWATRWFFRGLMTFSRLVAQGTAQIAPRAETTGRATGNAVLFGAIWPVIGVLLGALLGRGGGAVVGLCLGGFIGAIVGFSLLNRGLAEVKASGGAISLGEHKGPFDVPKPHIIERPTRVRHVAVFGATGSGKTTALQNLVSQDFAAPGKPGVMVVDIKDDLVLDIARRVPAERLDDVLLFDPADTAFPPSLNPFADVPEEGRSLAASELIAAFERLYAKSWGPRLEHVLRNVVMTLLEVPEATLLDIARLLTDPDYRNWALPHVTNFSVAEFWQREWIAIVGKNGSLSNIESILNKLSIFSYPEIRNVIGQTKRGVDFRRAMDRGQILLFNLPQGKLGEDASRFLASLVVGKAQLAGQSRVDLPHDQRRTFYLFADEFQNYQTGAFDKLITEGRSMGVGVVAACQYKEQLPLELRLTLEKNCAYSLHCWIEEGKHRIVVVKQQEPNAPDAVTFLKAAPPWERGDDAELATIRDQSRLQLGAPRAKVETDIARRMHQAQPDSSTQEAKANAHGASSNGSTPRTRRTVLDDDF